MAKSEEKFEIVIVTTCPSCGKPVTSFWTRHGMLSRPSVILMADVVFHSDCWNKVMTEYPPFLPETELDAIFASNPEIHDRWLECSLLLSHHGLLLELGTFRGRALRRLCRVTKRVVYGFDSYEGLPEDWKEGFPKGSFKTEPPAPDRIPSNGRLIIGDIRDTLPVFLQSQDENVAFVHFDLDVYSSTKVALDILKPRLAPGCVFLFDEIYDFPEETAHSEHEGRAFREFIAETGARIELLGRRRHEAWAFRVWLPQTKN